MEFIRGIEAIRLSVCGSTKVFYNVTDDSLVIMTEKDLLKQTCMPHYTDIDYYELDKFEIDNPDQFKSEREQKIIKEAFKRLWQLKMGQVIYKNRDGEQPFQYFDILSRYLRKLGKGL